MVTKNSPNDSSLSLNEKAMTLVQRLVDNAAYYKVEISRLKDGSTLIDGGLEGQGGLRAGELIAEISMGGLGSVDLTRLDLFDQKFPGVYVSTDHPLLSCLLSQLAGWSIKVGKFRALGSGPARALAQTEAVFDEYSYHDDHSEGVLILETSKKPSHKVSTYVSKKCKIDPKDLYIVITPTSSPAGNLQICSRIVETGIHKMNELDIDIGMIRSGIGSCPLPPLCKNDLTMMGRTNDAILYGGITHYQSLASLARDKIESIPSCSSPDYGKPFEELFKAAGGDFYKLDQGLFSPALVQINDLEEGSFDSSGLVNEEVLKESFDIT